MIYDVKVYAPDGKLKKEIPAQVLKDKVWKEEGLPTESYVEPEYISEADKLKDENREKKPCWACQKLFIPRSPKSVTCRSRKCKNKYYQKMGAVPKVEKICPRCKKSFMGTESRVYCNNPCKHTKVWARKQSKPFIFHERKNYVCATCKKLFKATQPREYCHTPCTDPNDKTTRPDIQLAERQCELCKKTFMPNTRKQIYCRNPCVSPPKKQSNLKRNLCKLCKKPFKTKGKNKYCYDPCDRFLARKLKDEAKKKDAESNHI